MGQIKAVAFKSLACSNKFQLPVRTGHSWHLSYAAKSAARLLKLCGAFSLVPNGRSVPASPQKVSPQTPDHAFLTGCRRACNGPGSAACQGLVIGQTPGEAPGTILTTGLECSSSGYEWLAGKENLHYLLFVASSFAQQRILKYSRTIRLLHV
jgi:hypothetical protein